MHDEEQRRCPNCGAYCDESFCQCDPEECDDCLYWQDYDSHEVDLGWDRHEYGGEVDAAGNVYSDADPGL